MMQMSACDLDGLRHGAVGDGRGVAPLPCLDDLDAQSIGPDRELLDGGRAKRVARAEHDLFPLRAEQVGQLGDRRRLARAVDADDQDHRRPARRQLESAARAAAGSCESRPSRSASTSSM